MSEIPTKLKQVADPNDNMDDPQVRSTAARHEAAHSVISESLYPGSVNSTALTPRGGMTDIQPPAGKQAVNQLNPDDIRNMIATSYAGGLSEPGGTTITHASADRAERGQVLAGRGTEAFGGALKLQTEGRARVEALLADPDIQKQIETLATHINTKGRLTGDEVRAVLRPSVSTPASKPLHPLHEHVKNVLQNAPIDQDTRADLWDRFFDSGHSYHLAKHLALYPSVPDDVKASLVAAKSTTDAPHLKPLEDTVAAIESMARLDPAVLEKVEAHPNVFQSLLRSK